jgi:glycosyltransferase involved in cell wall biosynthesis
MQNKHLSVCVLAYKRPEWLVETIESIIATADYPYTLIVNSDGNDSPENREYLNYCVKSNLISVLIQSGGSNRGVGRSFANCVGVCEGEYIAKIDTDLTFTKGWMSHSVRILEEQADVGAVGLFDYRKYDPNDKRFEVYATRFGCRLVNDLVSSAYIFRKSDLVDGYQYDDGFHQTLKAKRGQLALTPTDMATNRGFGVGKSVYVVGTEDHPRKAEITEHPLIFKNE